MARRYGAIFWQIEYLHAFPVPVSWNFSIPYKHFLEPYTRVLDLTLDDTSLLTQMHEKGRYNIRLAEKR